MDDSDARVGFERLDGPAGVVAVEDDDYLGCVRRVGEDVSDSLMKEIEIVVVLVAGGDKHRERVGHQARSLIYVLACGNLIFLNG